MRNGKRGQPGAGTGMRPYQGLPRRRIRSQVTNVEDVVEPYLLQEGFIKRTPRGRVMTIKAENHLRQADLIIDINE